MPEIVRDFLYRIESRELSHAHAHGVARMTETVRARHDAAVSAVRIRRRPISCAVDFARLNRAVADRRARQQPVAKRDRVNEGLECGTDLAICRSERAIEFALRVITAANECANAAAGVIDHNRRAFE